MPKAYSYRRFSSAKQADGDSIRRQTALAEAYAIKHGLDLDHSLSFEDVGISAWKGDNVTKGELGDFLKAVEDKKVAKGSYLLVENIDRLSREKVSDALTLFLNILRLRIKIVTLFNEKHYDWDTLDERDLIISLIEMSRAHEESQLKSKRISHSWRSKHSRADTEVVTKWLPAWLDLNAKGKIVAIPERVKIIRKMYKLALKGYGMRLILKEIEKLGVEPWGHSPAVKQTKRMPKKWHMSYINRILTERAVLGEYQPRRLKGGMEVVHDYYPRIISDEDFYKLQKERGERRVNKVAGRKGDGVTNLFTGLLKCGYSLDSHKSYYRCAGDNTSMSIANKGPKSATKYVQCIRVKEGNLGCEQCAKLWRYDEFEALFIDHLRNVDFLALSGKNESKSKLDDLTSEAEVLDGKIENHKLKIKRYQDLFENSSEDFQDFRERASQLETELKQLKAKKKRCLEEITLLSQHGKFTKADQIQARHLFRQYYKQKGKLSEEERVSLKHMIRQNIARIQVFSVGLLPHQARRKLYATHLSAEVVKNFDEGVAKHKNDPKSAMIVEYRSGETRTIISGSKPDKR